LSQVTSSQSAFDFADSDRRSANPTRGEAGAQVSPPLFAGSTYNAENDEVRLSRQMQGIFDCMKDGHWRTLAEIQAIVRAGSEASISARLRHFRKRQWGQNTVNRRRRGEVALGIHEYQLIVNPLKRFALEKAL
jgi:hypothetical protein